MLSLSIQNYEGIKENDYDSDAKILQFINNLTKTVRNQN